jgi:hypothetical protein
MCIHQSQYVEILGEFLSYHCIRKIYPSGIRKGQGACTWGDKLWRSSIRNRTKTGILGGDGDVSEKLECSVEFIY